jgi:hypothetical protein
MLVNIIARRLQCNLLPEHSYAADYFSTLPVTAVTAKRSLSGVNVADRRAAQLRPRMDEEHNTISYPALWEQKKLLCFVIKHKAVGLLLVRLTMNCCLWVVAVYF